MILVSAFSEHIRFIIEQRKFMIRIEANSSLNSAT